MHGHVSKHVKMQIKPTGAQKRMASISSQGAEKGKGMHEATSITEMPPKLLHPDKATWVSDVTTQDQAQGRRQMWPSLEQERLIQA